MRISRFFLLVSALIVSVTSAQAGDLEAGKQMSKACSACHGANGISPNTAWPNLAGQQSAYLVKQMKDFREGKRTDPWMSPMAKPLSDKDIENLAAFYNELPVRDEYQ